MVVVVVVVVVVLFVVLFVMPIAVLGVDDHFVVAMVLFVVMGMLRLGVNPTRRRRESEISKREHVL
ncbi:MAG TPA: hypothetical protein VF294_02620 [Polyangiaceae bacterium]